MKKILIVLIFPLFLGTICTEKSDGKEIAGTKVINGEKVCFREDPYQEYNNYFSGAEKIYKRVKGKNSEYEFRDFGIRFSIASENNYYVFVDDYQSEVLKSLGTVYILPFSDVGCLSADLNNSITIRTGEIKVSPKILAEIEAGQAKDAEEKMVTLGDDTFLKTTVPLEGKNPYITYKIERGGLFYTLGTSRYPQDQEMMERLVTSLEFI